MAYRLLGAKTLSESILVYCHMDHLEQFLWRFNQNKAVSIQENWFKKFAWEKWQFGLGLNVFSYYMHIRRFAYHLLRQNTKSRSSRTKSFLVAALDCRLRSAYVASALAFGIYDYLWTSQRALADADTVNLNACMCSQICGKNIVRNNELLKYLLATEVCRILYQHNHH